MHSCTWAFLQCDFDHESKRKCRKVSNFGWVAFVLQLFHIGMTIDNLKEKDNMENKMENTNDRRANYKDSVKKRLTELEIGLRIQDKQIVKL